MTVPACVNPLMLAMQGGDPLDELGKIERSVRLRRAVAACFTRTPPVAGNRKTWTFSVWTKLSKILTAMDLLSYYTTGINETICFGADGCLYRYCADTSGVINRVLVSTTAVHRDSASFLHIVVNQDTTNATDTERVRIYRDNVRAQISASALPALDYETYLNASVPHTLGSGNAGACDSNFAHVAFVVGAVLPPTAFGQTHPRTGQWRPKSKAAIRAAVAAAGGTVRNGWGTNGFFLPFDDTSSLTALGYDRSQSDTDTTGNNWTPTNISLTPGATYDSMLDTPTNVFPTLNPLDVTLGVYSNGNLRFTNSNLDHRTCRATMSLPASAIYFEGTVVSATGANVAAYIGLSTANATQNTYQTRGVWSCGGTVGVMRLYDQITQLTAPAGAVAAGDVLQCAYDGATGKVWFGKNDTWYDASGGTTGNPSSKTNQTATTSGTVFPWADCYADSIDFNFGQLPFAYTPPTGFKALCSKNLPYPRLANPKSAFVAVTDTGANIQAALAAARTGWSDYIDIIKRRDAAEGWRWVFSDDSANYLDSSSSGAKAAVPSFSGTAYVGYSLKVSSANGVATGRLNHVSGVADVVADGLANSRKMIFLKNEASGTWYVYHPDLTAGKLLYLEQTAGETTDATISVVTASGFTVAAALASGTYRWLAMAEVDGFLKLGFHIGNVSTDGPFDQLAHSPLAFLVKWADAGQSGGWHLLNAALSTGNPIKQYFTLESTAAEMAADFGDLTSSGCKLRNTSVAWNASGGKYVYLSFAAFPFRYANAR